MTQTTRSTTPTPALEISGVYPAADVLEALVTSQRAITAAASVPTYTEVQLLMERVLGASRAAKEAERATNLLDMGCGAPDEDILHRDLNAAARHTCASLDGIVLTLARLATQVEHVVGPDLLRERQPALLSTYCATVRRDQAGEEAAS